MRKAILLSSVLLFSIRIGWATEISGPLSGTLPRSGSPYQVVGDIWVPQGYSLIIQPGVILDFQGPYSLEIRWGTSLYAMGTADDSITFTCDTLLFPESWRGIKSDSARTVRLRYCIVENSRQCGLWFRGQYNSESLIDITHCLICHNSSPDSLGIGGGATFELISDLTLSENTFLANRAYDGGGIHLDVGRAAISGSNILGNEASYGGGISSVNGVSIAGCLIQGNSATECGGILLRGGGSIIANQITRNSAPTGYGGGICCRSHGACSLSDNIIQDNDAQIGGGIAILDSATVTMRRNQISSNSAMLKGGGVWLAPGDPGVSLDFWFRLPMFQNIITGNSAPRYPAAFLGGPILATIANNTICNSLGDGSGPAFECDSSVSGIVGNCVFWNNGAEDVSAGPDLNVQYSDIMQAYPGLGNISLDPLFRDTTTGDFHLMSISCGDPFDSPCVDIASPEYRDDTLSCQWGLGDSLCDMGAYGGGHARCLYVVGDANNSGESNGVDIVYLVNFFKGYGPAPPVICFDCPDPGETFYGACDANGNCSCNGVDITYRVNYFKGIGSPPYPCPACPPGQ